MHQANGPHEHCFGYCNVVAQPKRTSFLAEAAHVRIQIDDFLQVLAPSGLPSKVLFDIVGLDLQLLAHIPKQRQRHSLPGFGRPARITKQAQLDGKSKAVGIAPPPLDAEQVAMLGQAELARYRGLESLLTDPAMADPNPSRAANIPKDQQAFLAAYESREAEMIRFLKERKLITLPCAAMLTTR